MELDVGTRITWQSAAGFCRGIIKKIVLKPAASGEITPWLIIDRFLTKDDSITAGIMLCGSHSNLKIMKVKLG